MALFISTLFELAFVPDKDEAIICRHSVRRVTTADKRQSEFFARVDADRVGVSSNDVDLL